MLNVKNIFPYVAAITVLIGFLARHEVAYSESIPIPHEVVSWKLGGKTGNVKSQYNYTTNTGYSLLNVQHGQYLTWGKQKFGVNLVFANSDSDKKVHFASADKEERDILTGENVAFGIGGGEAYLCYADRKVGINLVWRKAPCYEWRLYDASGDGGKTISVGSLIAIGNINVKPEADFLIYLDRVGADVGWTSSPGWSDKLSAAAKTGLSAAKKVLF